MGKMRRRQNRHLPVKKRDGEAASNVRPLFSLTRGTPLREIPKRPLIEPIIGAQDNNENELGLLAEALKLALDGYIRRGVKKYQRSKTSPTRSEVMTFPKKKKSTRRKEST